MSTLSAAPRFRVGSLLQLLISLLGSGICGLIALGLLIYQFFYAEPNLSLFQPRYDFYALAWVFGFLAVLGLPSIWFAGRDLAGHPAPAPDRSRRFAAASIGLVLWPLVLLAGSFVSSNASLELIRPPMTILASMIPIWFLVELARRGLKSSSPQRSWGVLNFALFFSNPGAIVAEVILIIVLAIGAIVVVVSIPGMSDQIIRLSQDIQSLGNDPQQIQRLLLPYLSNPWVLVGAFSIFSLFVPLLEELFKPLAVWAILGHGADAGEGLAAGAIAGAGFTITETLFNLSSPALSGQWVVVVVGRAGTGILHITTAAIIGMSMAAAWKNRKHWWYPVLAYLGAVALHGLWNAFSVSSGLFQFLVPSKSLANILSVSSVGGLFLLAAVFVAILIFANRRLRHSTLPSPIQPG